MIERNWWHGSLTLTPESGKSHIELYDSTSKSFKSIQATTLDANSGSTYVVDDATGSTKLSGPFVYITSTLVSRFEDNFVVAPFRSPSSRLPPSTATNGSIDIILIRPLRNRATAEMFRAAGRDKKKEGDVRSTYSGMVWDVMKGMYNAGTHVDTNYLSFEPNPKSVVEYLRAGGMSWEPVSRSSCCSEARQRKDLQRTDSTRDSTRDSAQDPSDDIKDNVVCLDGALRDLGNGGKLETRPLSAKSSGVSIWC